MRSSSFACLFHAFTGRFDRRGQSHSSSRNDGQVENESVPSVLPAIGVFGTGAAAPPTRDPSPPLESASDRDAHGFVRLERVPWISRVWWGKRVTRRAGRSRVDAPESMLACTHLTLVSLSSWTSVGRSGHQRLISNPLR